MLVYAEWKSITCVNPTNKLSQTIEFDESTNRVRINGRSPIPASINKSTIVFEEVLSTATFFQTINRSTGTLVVIDNRTSSIDSTYNCSVTKNKF